MDDDHTKAHRRRSSSLVFAAGSTKHHHSPSHGYSHSTHLTHAGDGIAVGGIPEESDTAPSSSDLEMDEMHDRRHSPGREDEDTDYEYDDDEETGLTQAERRKRRRRRRRNTRLDERVARSREDDDDDDGLHRAEEQLTRATLVSQYGVNALLIALWYSFSISISVYNKWMFSKENLDFHYPLFTTSLHMVVQFSLASAVLFFLPQFRPGASRTPDPHSAQDYTRVDGSHGDDDEESDHSPPSDPTTTKPPKPALMTRMFYLTRITPCGTATALDIGLGNFSLRFISLTFFTMCKSSVLAFVLLFAFLFKLETPSLKLLAIITLMTTGVIMMVAGETAFNALGFILVMSASFCSGFRWSLTQILLLRNPATGNPFSSIFFLTPVMWACLLLLALPIEGPANLVAGLHTLTQAKGSLLGIAILLFPGVLAFLMVAAEFALLQRTSVVTLSVCGIFKEVLTISAAGVAFGDELSPINVSGLVVTIASIAGYNYLKYAKMREEAREKARLLLVAEGAGEDGVGKAGAVGESGARPSASGLLRSSLALETGSPATAGGKKGHAHSNSLSPDKRPEDLE